MGTVNGILLALEKYIPKYKSGEEGVVMNVSSIAGVIYHGGAPIYCGTKFAIHGMTLSWGVQAHYERTKVRVVALAPGGTKTALFDNAENKVLAPIYKNILISEAPPVPFQELVSVFFFYTGYSKISLYVQKYDCRGSLKSPSPVFYQLLLFITFVK